jgi:molybdopterin/thiamine biosynthesis adenylyltransferase
MMEDLSERYDRQIMIDGFGEEGQKRLRESCVFIAGAGGLGSPAAIYLAAAGVGRIRIVDHDKVDLSNLNRQILHWEQDIGRVKVESAKDKLHLMNQDVRIEGVEETIDKENVFDLISDCDLIVDALDNFPTRYLLNRAALEKGIPFFHGGVYGFEGRVMTVIPGKSACFRCLYKKGPPKFKFPVIGVTPAVIGSIQATEVIKYLTGIGELLTDRLLVYDGLSMTFMEMKLKKDPECEDCGKLK